MKKFIAKKGFTLVEVMVAFVIFAIMAAMISVLLNTTMTAKQNNLDVERDIEQQQANYYLTDPNRSFDDSAGKDGTASYSFVQADGTAIGSAFTIDYQRENTVRDGEDPLLSYDYFVGDVDYDSYIKSQKDAEKSGGGGSLIDNVDSRIYATSGIRSMNIKVTDKGGNLYWFEALINGADVDPAYRVLAQVKMLFPSAILDYGYVANGMQSDYASAAHSIRLRTLSGNALRIAGPNSEGSVGNATDTTELSMFKGTSYQGFWVQLASPLPTTIDASGTTRVDLEQVFGTSTSDEDSVWNGTSYYYTPYLDTSGDEDITYVNVLAGFPNAVPGDSGTAEA